MPTLKKIDKIVKEVNHLFELHKKKVLKLLPNADVDHVGSTAIPYSITKGDLDILVRVKSNDFSKAIKRLSKFYKVAQRKNWTKSFASFKDDTETIPVGIQLTIRESGLDDFLRIRNILMDDPKLLKAYNNLKLKFQNEKMRKYRKAKADFFEKIKELQ